MNPDAILVHLIADYFDLEELRHLCFQCGIDFDNLRGDTKQAKAREMVLHCRNRGLIEAPLLCELEKSRTNVPWCKAIESGTSNFVQAIPAWLLGRWQGEWEWYEQKREADLRIDYRKSTLRVKYWKDETLTIVEQEINVVEVDGTVFLKGTDYEFIEQGEATGYYLDSFTLYANPRKTTLTGVKIDSREITSEVSFKKQQ